MSVDHDVLFRQVPAARPNDERRSLLIQCVVFAIGVKLNAASDGIAQIDLPLNDVVPRRR